MLFDFFLKSCIISPVLGGFMKGKVSIIIAIYSIEKYLGECLNSVINQTYKDLEIILVNDGSSDRSLDIMNAYSKIDNRIICISQENAGPGMARNKGLDYATGKYISFIDGDDSVKPDFIEKLVSIIKEDDLYSYCGISVNGEDTFLSPEKNSLFIRQCCYNKLYNAKYLDGVRFTSHMFAEDLIFNYELSFLSKNISYTEEPLYFYRRNESSISNTWSDKYMEIFKPIGDIVNYKNLDELDFSRRERLEFLLVWYLFFGNFKRAGKNIDSDYVKKSIDYVEQFFPNWYENKFVDKYIWDKEICDHIKNKDYDDISSHYSK